MKKLLSILLALALVVGIIPLAAAAEGTHNGWTAIGSIEDLKNNCSEDYAIGWNNGGSYSYWSVYRLPSGNYYLTGDLTLDFPILVKDGVDLCLHDHSITLAHSDDDKYAGIFFVTSGGALTLQDDGTTPHSYYCGQTFQLDGEATSSTGTFTGGYITGGKPWSFDNGDTFPGGVSSVDLPGSYSLGGAFYVTDGASLNIAGGTICGNHTQGMGGGVFLYHSNLNMTGGAICGNEADTGGGVAVFHGSTFNMTGGSIQDNKAVGQYGDGYSGAGGGVYVSEENGQTRSSFTMSGDNTQLLRNSTDGNGGGVCVAYGQEATINGGTIGGDGETQNAENGGGIYCLGELEMTAGTITKNKATFGSGLCMTVPRGDIAGSAEITGTTRITGNGRATYGTGVFMGGQYSNGGGMHAKPADMTVDDTPVIEEVFLGGAFDLGYEGTHPYSPAFIWDGGIGAGASITVRTYDTPTKEEPVLVAKQQTQNHISMDYYHSADRSYTVKKDAIPTGTEFGDMEVILLTVQDTPYYPVSAYNIKVLPADNGAARASKSTAQRGETITITGEGAEGYKLLDVDVRDSQNKPVETARQENGSFTFTMPADNVTVQPTFADADFVDAVYCDMGEECPLVDYIDVFADRWYHHGVHFMLKKGFMTGTDTNIFSPKVVSTRAMAITVLWRMAGSPVVDYAMPFTDVAEGKWYTEAVRWGASQGIISGHKGTTLYCPDDPVTREQMAVILYYAGKATGFDLSLGDETEPLPFQDQNRISFYARTAVRWAYHHEILYGREDGLLAPKQGTTRAELAQFLYRLFPRGYLANK